MTPWFKVTTNRARVVFPHALAVGENSQVAAVRVAGRWETVAKGITALPVFRVGDAIVVVGETTMIFRKDALEPRLLPVDICPDGFLRRDAPTFICVGCGTLPPLRPLPQRGEPACEALTMTEITLDGLSLWTLTAALTPPGPVCGEPWLEHAVTASGLPIVRLDCLQDKRWVPHRLSPGDDGFVELPPDAPVSPARAPETP